MNTTKLGMQSVHVDAMVPADWAHVSSIYLEGLASGNATFETLEPTWEEWDRAHLPFGRVVAREGKTIAGWAALARVSHRSCYAGVAEMSVYVASWARGRRVGTALMEASIAEAEKAGIWTLQAGIFPENAASIDVHGKVGFRIVGVREKLGVMDGRWRDVVLMERRSGVVGV